MRDFHTLVKPKDLRLRNGKTGNFKALTQVGHTFAVANNSNFKPEVTDLHVPGTVVGKSVFSPLSQNTLPLSAMTPDISKLSFRAQSLFFALGALVRPGVNF